MDERCFVCHNPVALESQFCAQCLLHLPQADMPLPALSPTWVAENIDAPCPLANDSEVQRLPPHEVLQIGAEPGQEALADSASHWAFLASNVPQSESSSVTTSNTPNNIHGIKIEEPLSSLDALVSASSVEDLRYEGLEAGGRHPASASRGLSKHSARSSKGAAAAAVDLRQYPLRVDMTTSRIHTVDHVHTPEGIVTVLRLTRKNEMTRNTALLMDIPLPPLHCASVARIDLIEGEVQLSLPQRAVEIAFAENTESSQQGKYWAKLGSWFFNSSARSQDRLWLSQRRKTLFLFFSGSLWGIPVFISPRETQGADDGKSQFAVLHDEGMRSLLNKFYQDFARRHPGDVFAQPNIARSLREFALLGKPAYIGIYISLLHDKNEPDDAGTTALHIAADAGHLGCVYRLLQGGATVNIQDKLGNLPLHYAAAKGYTEVTILLSSSHFSTLRVRNGEGKTASDVASDNRRNLLAALLNPGMYRGRLASKQRAYPAVETGDSSFHQAVIDGDLDTVRRLLSMPGRKHHPNEPGPHSDTPIMLASRHGRFDVLLALLVELQNCSPALRQISVRNQDSQTPLIAAAKAGHADCLLALLKFRGTMPFDIDETDTEGKTALHYACAEGRAMCTFLLVANNANSSLLDVHGCPPVHYAQVNSHALTEQIVSSARAHLDSSHSPDIQRFLESFGFVNRMDMFDTFADISGRMEHSLRMATDEFASDDDTLGGYGTDNSFESTEDVHRSRQTSETLEEGSVE